MKTSDLIHYTFHPNQLRAIIQWKVWHNPLNKRDPTTETPTLRRCFEFLDLTSRSFSAVIQELCPELCVSVSLFYLVLRGLDTIEDDMTIPIEIKEPILRDFDKILDQHGWTFNGNGPNEKDRQLLVEFDVVITEFAKIPKEHQVIIKDITRKMGNGMADYANNTAHQLNGVNTIEDYDLYCHYVAGLVGEGLTRLFVVAEKANKILLERGNLSNSMGLFLQKTNIIRDYREDLEDKRGFWPREIWSRHVKGYKDLADPKNEEAALNCISDMCLDALRHAEDCLFYLAGIREQSVFNFCAIPQVMAIATIALIFRNKNVFQRNVKIPKGEACELLLSVGNLRTVCETFRKYIRIIHAKNTPKDPNFLRISAACGKVEQWIENVFPKDKPAPAPRPTGPQLTPAEEAAQKKEMMMLTMTIIGTMVVMSGLMLFGAWMAGARFDLAFKEVAKHGFNLLPSRQEGAPAAHQEL